MNSWQYNGIARWFEITEWCAKNLKHAYSKHETVYFPNDREYTLFLLRWS